MVDGIVIFRSPELHHTPHVNNTSLNFLDDNGDIIFHIGFRRHENAIVFNCRRGDQWLREERTRFANKLDGQNHTVAVFDHGNSYQVLINGSTAYYFKKQLSGKATSLQYLLDAGQVPMFSDPILVETYTNWAALVPGSM